MRGNALGSIDAPAPPPLALALALALALVLVLVLSAERRAAVQPRYFGSSPICLPTSV